jgi:hypothetical protein
VVQEVDEQRQELEVAETVTATGQSTAGPLVGNSQTTLPTSNQTLPHSFLDNPSSDKEPHLNKHNPDLQSAAFPNPLPPT